MSMIKLMKNCLLVLLAILLYCYIAILPSSKPVFAADGDPTPMGATDVNLHSWTQISSLDVVSSLTCQIVGYDPAKPEGTGCVFYGQQGNLQVMNRAGGGAVAFAGNLIASLYANPPASGVQYLADLGKNLGIGKPAYAAVGTGYSGLSPIMPIWKAFRNIAYLFFTIIFIVIGFAIMFRVKISPQAVVTIQAALPRIVIALILVTFSYAIAGFMIDLMYVVISLVVAILTGPAPLLPKEQVGELQQQILTGGVPQMAGSMFQTGFAAIFALGKAFVAQATLIGAVIGAVIGGLATISVGGVGVIPGFIAGAIAPSAIVILIISIAILYALFKLFLSLLMAYIGIIISVILAPLQIMLGALPGQSGFGAWFRNLTANLAVFPAVVVMLLLGRILTSASSQNLWSPPLLWGATANIVQALIGIGIILMTPKVADMVKDALKVPAFKYGTAVGEALGTGWGVTRAGAEASPVGQWWRRRGERAQIERQEQWKQELGGRSSASSTQPGRQS